MGSEADRINQRFQAGRWRPIVFLKRHHSHEQIERYYRAADLCMVTSLHDGMNLVAKEFVASREDESGVLVLSTFTGASRELGDALLVNPYDKQQVAEAIRTALEMSPEEVARRMHRMRRIVREQNIYRWAGNLLLGSLRIAGGGAGSTGRGRVTRSARRPVLLWAHWDEILRKMREARSVAFFLDYDGTISPRVPRPEQAVMAGRCVAVARTARPATARLDGRYQRPAERRHRAAHPRARESAIWDCMAGRRKKSCGYLARRGELALAPRDTIG